MPERKNSRKKTNTAKGFGPVFIARAGAKGACSVCLIFFGVVFIGIGGTLFAAGGASEETSNKDKPKTLDDPFFDDPFARGDSAFESIHRPMQVTGPILIGVGAFLVIVASIMCVYIARKGSNPLRHTKVAGPSLQGKTEAASSSKQRQGLPPDYAARPSRSTTPPPTLQLLSAEPVDHHVGLGPDHIHLHGGSGMYEPSVVQPPARVPPRTRPAPTYSRLTSVPEE